MRSVCFGVLNPLAAETLLAAPFGAFEEAPVAAIRPKGHLEEFLRRQADGITGHPEKLG